MCTLSERVSGLLSGVVSAYPCGEDECRLSPFLCSAEHREPPSCRSLMLASRTASVAGLLRSGALITPFSLCLTAKLAACRPTELVPGPRHCASRQGVQQPPSRCLTTLPCHDSDLVITAAPAACTWKPSFARGVVVKVWASPGWHPVLVLLASSLSGGTPPGWCCMRTLLACSCSGSMLLCRWVPGHSGDAGMLIAGRMLLVFCGGPLLS